MKVLVTGGAGFIASHLVDRYLVDGYQVVVIDNLSTGFKSNLNSRAIFYQVDIRSKEINRILFKEKPKVINHHAAQIDLRKSVADPLEDAQINILGLVNLMEAAVKVGTVKQVIFASSGGAIYGDAKLIPTHETYAAWPISPYGIAKLASEHYLYYYQRNHRLPFVSLRYGNVYGPRQNPHGEAGVIAIFAERLLKGNKVVINGDGKQTRDFVYVDDVVEANLAVMLKDIQGVFNIGTGKETDVNTIHQKLAKLVDSQAKAVHGPSKEGEQQRSALDCNKAYQLLNWKAKISLDEGLRKTVEFFSNK